MCRYTYFRELIVRWYDMKYALLGQVTVESYHFSLRIPKTSNRCLFWWSLWVHGGCIPNSKILCLNLHPCSLNREPEKWTEWRRQFLFFFFLKSWCLSSLCNLWVVSLIANLHSDVLFNLFFVFGTSTINYNLAISGFAVNEEWWKLEWLTWKNVYGYWYWLYGFINNWIDTLR